MMTSLKNNLITKLIDRLFDILKNESDISPFHATSQISYLLLIKRVNPDVWEHIKSGNQSEQIIHIIQDKSFPEIKRQLVDSYGISYEVLDAMEFKITNMKMLHECVDVIDNIHNEANIRITKSLFYYDIDGIIFDELYEKSIKKSQNAQNLYIPRHIRNMMAALTEANYSGDIYDPMCSSGGMLLSIYEKVMQEKHENKIEDTISLDSDGFNTFQYSSISSSVSPSVLCGSDPNIEQLLLAILNFKLRGIAKANLQLDNFIQNESPQYFDVVIANPPFGQKLDKPYWNDGITTKNTEIAFIDKITSSLTSNGKATIIVSEGFLTKTNAQFSQCRARLIAQNRLEAVISLPPGIFHNTQAKASLLILTKGENNRNQSLGTWFYELISDGYTNDSAKRRIKGYPLPEAVKAFKQRENDIKNERTEKSFFVSFKEIQENDWNLSYNRYKQFSYEKQDYENTDKLIFDIANNEKEIQNTLDELKSMLVWRQ